MTYSVFRLEKKTVLERFDFLISVLNERMRYCILWYLSIFHFLCKWNQKLLIKKTNNVFVVSCKTIYHNKPRVIVIFFNICVSMQTKLSPKETICMKDQSHFFLGRLWYFMLQVVFWGDNLLDISKPSSGKIRKLPSICPLLILPLSGKCELLAISSFILVVGLSKGFWCVVLVHLRFVWADNELACKTQS